MPRTYQLTARANDDAFRAVVLPADRGLVMWMPAGTHQITPSQDGQAVTVVVEVDAGAAKVAERQRRLLVASGKKPFFSIQHDKQVSAFWPKEFYWGKELDARGDMAEGVWARGMWSLSGRMAYEGKDFWTFSPTFFVDAIRNDFDDPLHVVVCEDAKANMGALENDPAFSRMSPLWARHAGAPGSSNNNQKGNAMKREEQLAELQASNQKLELTVNALRTKDDPASKAELKAAKSEIRANNETILRLEGEEKNEAATAALNARSEQDAQAAVDQMVADGEIPVRDTELQASYKSKFVKDPDLMKLRLSARKAVNDIGRKGNAAIASQLAPHGGSAALESGGYRVNKQDPRVVLKAVAALCARNSGAATALDKIAVSKEIGTIYRDELGALLAKDAGAFRLDAADYAGGDGLASQTVGILSGTLVAQRCLDLYKYEFPMLSSITTDFSDQPAQFGQTTETRVIVIPAVLSYNPALDATGRPQGYYIVTQAQTVDVPITLNKHRAVPIMFDANTLASTSRRLFEEQAPAAAYALGQDMVNSLYANITPANFNGNALTYALNAQLGNAPFQVNPTNYGRPTFSKAKRILNLQGTPFANRFTLSASDYQEQLEQDPTLVSLAVFQKPEIITEAQLPAISRFMPYEAPNLPATAFPAVSGASVLKAFFGHKSSLVMQARVPNDWSTVLGSGTGFGSVNVVTNTDTGLSTLLVQYSDPRSAFAEYRLAVIYGTAPGNKSGGLVVTN